MRRVLPETLLLAALLAGCPAPQAELEPSGFLGDYSQLEPGRADQAQLRYIDPEASFAGYERILIDPVVFWEGAATAELEISAEEQLRLAQHLDAALRRELQREFELVESPSPGTLRLRSAITAIRETSASIELEILDAPSGKRLIAVADVQGGDPKQEGRFANVEEAFVFWAGRARTRLAAFRDFDAAEAAHAGAARP